MWKKSGQKLQTWNNPDLHVRLSLKIVQSSDKIVRSRANRIPHF